MKELEADEVNAKRIERLIHAQSDVYQRLLQETRALSGDEYSVSADMNAYEIAGVIAVYLLDN